MEEKKKAPKKMAVVEEEEGDPAADLQAVFNQFSAGAKEIDGKVFAKLAVDCKIVNKKCSKTDIDLIFTKVKEKNARKITFPQFKTAVEQCAEKRGEPMADLEAAILQSGGKKLTGTQA